MPAVSLTFGNTVKSFPELDGNPSRKVQRAVRAILEKTAKEVVARLKIPGRDYNDRTGDLRKSWKKRRLNGYRYSVGSRMSYASYIENGTFRIEARRMLHREMYNARSRLRRRLSELAKKVRKGLI